jgi:hypothetical protein
MRVRRGESRSTGVLEYWSTGVLEYWSTGVLECWSVGVLECWSVGVLECWSVGVLRLALNKSAMLTGYAPTERPNADPPTRFP